MAAVAAGPDRRPGAAPVRPQRDVLEALLHAAALPGVAGGRLRAALEDGDRLGGGAPARAAALHRLAEEARQGLRAAEVDRARGWARRALETIHGEAVHVLLPGDRAYPTRLTHLHQPPCPLFARGRLELLESPMVAVVGTRSSTPYGREAAHRIAWGIGAAGVTVISGLAAGIDGVAHRAAGPARTVAVLGCGIDVFYPRAHRQLQEAIARQGLVLSEQLPGAPPARHNFPRRNRILAALAVGVVVVEAPPGSGALSTAAQAREGGVTVFAVPGPIHQRGSIGVNELIRDGAQLVTDAREVLAGLELPLPPVDAQEDVPPLELEGQGLALWRALGPEPRHVDEISAAVGLEPQRSLPSLLALEVRGHARQLPGLRFVRVRTGPGPAG